MAADIYDAHDAALQYGGQPGVISENSVLSAIARPYAEFGGRKLFPFHRGKSRGIDGGGRRQKSWLH